MLRNMAKKIKTALKKKAPAKTFTQYKRKKDGKFVGRKYAERYPHLVVTKRVKRKA